MRKKVITVFCVLCGVGLAFGNNVRISGVDLRQYDRKAGEAQVVFDVSWENSWRNTVNHDAVWVFVKFCQQEDGEWQHALLAPESEGHVAPVGCKIDVAGDGVGAFLYAANAVTGNVSFARVRLVWQFGEAEPEVKIHDELKVSVHAIEMVYVPEGSFYLGSGGTESGSFTDGGWIAGPSWPYAITSEEALQIAPEPGALWGRSASGNNSIGVAGELPAAYPKGYGAFYCMKYQVSEGQYAAFLNHLTPAQATTRYSGMYGTYNHSIHMVDEVYVSDAPDRACGYAGWVDGAAYLDWSGLRPMTELEFEKACRGPAAPVPSECAWGAATPLVEQSGYEGVVGSGSETALPVNASLVKTSTLGGLSRAGIFAATATSRTTAGASYWGIMELSSHPALLMVSVASTTGRAFTGSHGDGVLSAAGFATNSDWPGYNSSRKDVNGATGSGFRGTHSNNPRTLFPQISDRENAALANSTRYAHHGVRGVRSAP